MVQSTGLWLHHTGILGASPDGIVPELDAVVEVKCPYSARNNTIAEACQRKDFCLCSDDDDAIRLCITHHYMDQIQGQMYLSGTTKCFFVVYTNKECCSIEVEKDDSWGENIDSLVQFLPARHYASAGICDSDVSVCLSVRPSVTRRYCA